MTEQLTIYRSRLKVTESRDVTTTIGLLVGEITQRAGQLSKNTQLFLVTIDGHLWRG